MSTSSSRLLCTTEKSGVYFTNAQLRIVGDVKSHFVLVEVFFFGRVLSQNNRPSQLFKEIGQDLAQALQNGREFSQTIATYPFFKKELSLIIEYGEVKSKLGSELEIYAEKTWEAFFTRVNRTMNLVQPLVFIFVALIIVLLYAAMLMPMYQNMEVNF